MSEIIGKLLESEISDNSLLVRIEGLTSEIEENNNVLWKASLNLARSTVIEQREKYANYSRARYKAEWRYEDIVDTLRTLKRNLEITEKSLGIIDKKG